MVDAKDKQHAKIVESLENLSKRVLTLASGKFTGTVMYELNLGGGTFQIDHFTSRGRMTPKPSEEKE